jgi:hypothetical protein
VSVTGRVLLGVFTLFVAGVTVMVAVLAVASGPRSDTAEPELGGPANVYAYLKVENSGDSWATMESRLVLMDGTEYIGGEDLLLGDDPLFTLDGAYVFSRVPLLDEIVAISVADGESFTVPCEGCDDLMTECFCQGVVPVGGSRIAWLDAERRLVLVDLAAESPAPQQTGVVVPTAEGMFDPELPALVAGADGLALAAYPGELYGSPTPIYMVPLEGEPRKLDGVRPDSVRAAAFSADGAQVALVGTDDSTCTTITVLEVASGQGTTAPVVAEPGAACNGQDVYVNSIWWDPDGVLNAYCAPDYYAADGTAELQRRFEGGAWVAAHDDDLEQHLLDSGASVSVVRSDVPDDFTGDVPDEPQFFKVLEFTANGETHRIDHSVSNVVIAPPAATAHR